MEIAFILITNKFQFRKREKLESWHYGVRLYNTDKIYKAIRTGISDTLKRKPSESVRNKLPRANLWFRPTAARSKKG